MSQSTEAPHPGTPRHTTESWTIVLGVVLGLAVLAAIVPLAFWPVALAAATAVYTAGYWTGRRSAEERYMTGDRHAH